MSASQVIISQMFLRSSFSPHEQTLYTKADHGFIVIRSWLKWAQPKKVSSNLGVLGILQITKITEIFFTQTVHYCIRGECWVLKMKWALNTTKILILNAIMGAERYEIKGKVMIINNWRISPRALHCCTLGQAVSYLSIWTFFWWLDSRPWESDRSDQKSLLEIA